MVVEVSLGSVVVSATVDMITNPDIIRKGDYSFIINVSREALLPPTGRTTGLAAWSVFLKMKSIVLHIASHHYELHFALLHFALSLALSGSHGQLSFCQHVALDNCRHFYLKVQKCKVHYHVS